MDSMNLNIVYKKISEINEYQNNPRINDEAIEPVMESIKNFGFLVPVVLDKSNVIIAGHTRKKVAEKLHMETIPCIYAEYLTDEQVKAFRLADNKTAEFSQWDIEKLEKELSDIMDIDMESLFHFADFDTENIDVSDDDFLQQYESSQNKKNKMIVCPHCGKEFET